MNNTIEFQILNWEKNRKNDPDNNWQLGIEIQKKSKEKSRMNGLHGRSETNDKVSGLRDILRLLVCVCVSFLI